MSWISSVYLMLFLEITAKWLKMILCVVEAQRIRVVGATVPPFGVCRASSVIPAPFVIPAKAGIQSTSRRFQRRVISLDTGFRRHDGLSAAIQTPSLSPHLSSSPRKRGSSQPVAAFGGASSHWIPAFAGTTGSLPLCKRPRHSREGGNPVKQTQAYSPVATPSRRRSTLGCRSHPHPGVQAITWPPRRAAPRAQDHTSKKNPA